MIFSRLDIFSSPSEFLLLNLSLTNSKSVFESLKSFNGQYKEEIEQALTMETYAWHIFNSEYTELRKVPGCENAQDLPAVTNEEVPFVTQLIDMFKVPKNAERRKIRKNATAEELNEDRKYFAKTAQKY